MPFPETEEGQTHSYNDGCGEPAHNGVIEAEIVESPVVEGQEQKPKHAGGRPTIMTPDVIKKLEEVFLIGGTDAEACFYADISQPTLYNYQKDNPEFVDRKERMKEKPFLKARQTFVKALDNPQYALEFLKRKRKEEFGDNTRIDGKIVNTNLNVDADRDATPEERDAVKRALLATIPTEPSEA